MANKFKVGDMVKIIACYEHDDAAIGGLIGNIGIIDGFSSIGSAEIHLSQFPEHAVVGMFKLHNCDGKYKENKYIVLGEKNLKLVSQSNQQDKWSKGQILISKNKKDLVKYLGQNKNDDGCFVGSVVATKKIDREPTSDYWFKFRFEIATRENTPKEWWEYLPATITDVAQEITNTMRGENNMEKELKIGDLVLVKSCNPNEEDYSRLIGCRGKIVSIGTNDCKVLFDSLPERFNAGDFGLHDGGLGGVRKHACILKKDVVLVDDLEPTILISKDKKILVEFINDTNENNFEGRLLIKDNEYVTIFKIGDHGKFWRKDAFEPATKENIPDKWKHILPESKPIEEIKEICSECVEIKREDEKPKYKVIKLSPTENQERQYGVYLFNNMTNIVNGQTVAFINSKTSGGVIYGKKAGALLYKLKQNNPNKLITIVKKLKSKGIKQISIRIVHKEKNEFTL